METPVANADAMRQYAAQFISSLSTEAHATIVRLSGELGAGKTTFTQAAAKALGVEETVNSPTFVIEKIYALQNQKWQRLVHIDAYRLKSAHELRALGWDEIIADPTTLIIIEWPEHVGEAIPDTAHSIKIEIGEGEARIVHHGN